MSEPRPDDDLAYVQDGLGTHLDAVLIYNLLRTHSYLSPFLDASLRGRHMTGAQFNAMLLLHSAGDKGLLMSEIGEGLVVTKSNVTGLMDRLEKHGMVTRCKGDDRRATVIRLTPEGKQQVEQAVPEHAKLLEELTGCLDENEKETLVRTLTKLRRALRKRRKECC